jgi:hypothetical protein
MGIVAVAPEKISRAVNLLGNILSGTTVTFNQYRSFIGLLDHILLFAGGDRTFMYHLYGRNFHAGRSGGPLSRMIFSPTHKRTEGRAPVWGSEFTSKDAALQGESRRNRC